MRFIPLWQWLVAFFNQTGQMEIDDGAQLHLTPSAEEPPTTASNPAAARDQVESIYRAKIRDFQQKRDLAKVQQGTCYSYLFVSLLALAATFYLSFGTRLFSPFVAILPVLAALVAYGEARKRGRRVKNCERLVEMYERGLQRVQHEWMGKGDPGLDLLVSDHLSARDLDLFGEGSLFELLCDVQTPAGRDALAQWLQTPASSEEVTARQEAVRALRDRTDLREKLALVRDANASEYSWNRLRNWPTLSPVGFSDLTPWLALLLSLGMAGIAVWAWLGNLEVDAALRMAAILGIIEGGLALSLRSQVLLVLENLHLPSHRLESLRQICLLLEQERPTCARLREIQEKLHNAARKISTLQRLVRLRELRDNEYSFWFLFPLLWSTQWTIQIERWRQTPGAGFCNTSRFWANLRP